MTRKQRRLTLIGLAGVVLAAAAGLVLFALRDSLVYFHGPTDIIEKKIAAGSRIRVGGLVAAGSVVKSAGQRIAFSVTDGNNAVAVTYTGLVPDLFREGQGVVTEGVLQADGSFAAETLLAKHDENYMPREVADTLKKQGLWKDGKPPQGAKQP